MKNTKYELNIIQQINSQKVRDPVLLAILESSQLTGVPFQLILSIYLIETNQRNKFQRLLEIIFLKINIFLYYCFDFPLINITVGYMQIKISNILDNQNVIYLKKNSSLKLLVPYNKRIIVAEQLLRISNISTIYDASIFLKKIIINKSIVKSKIPYSLNEVTAIARSYNGEQVLKGIYPKVLYILLNSL
ncbi:MAG: hypothetical protein AAGU27_17090 [Dehalobacterium sp.]